MSFEKKAYYDCVAYVTERFFKQYDRDILPLYLGGFGFIYKKSKEGTLLEDTIISAKQISDETMLFFSGLSKCSVVFDKNNFLNELIDYLSSNLILGVFLDSYYCPWNKYYMRIHRKHCVAVIGYDLNNRVLEIYDGYLSNQIEHLEIELFKMGYIESFKYSEHGAPKRLSAKDALKMIYDFSCNTFDRRAQNILEFHGNIVSFDYKKCHCDYNFEFSNLCLSLSYLIWNRIGLKECLTHSIVQDESCHLYVLKELLEFNVMLWENYRCCFMKSLFSRSNRYEKKLNATINSIIDNELALLNYLVDHVDQSSDVM